jgi:hypothetical protein
MKGERGFSDASGPGRGHDAVGGEKVAHQFHGCQPANQVRDHGRDMGGWNSRGLVYAINAEAV